MKKTLVASIIIISLGLIILFSYRNKFAEIMKPEKKDVTSIFPDYIDSLDKLALYISIPYDKKLGISLPSSITSNVFTRALISAERWWNEGTRTYSKQSKISEIDLQYQPQYDSSLFNVPVYKVDKNKVEITTAYPDDQIKNEYLLEKEVIFPVHPEIIGDMTVPNLANMEIRPIEKMIKVTPTASSRAVIVDDSSLPLYAAKLHLPRKISRYCRNLGPTTIKHSITISGILRSIKFEKFAYLPETMGVSFPNKGSIRGWGFIIRQLQPYPKVDEQRLQIPFFALYAKNPVISGGDPLLVTLIKLSGEDPIKYILDYIMFPLIECWIVAVRQQGILMESHGQNTLLEVNNKFIPTRIIHKDLDNWVDVSRRKKLGLSTENFHPTQTMVPSEQEPKGSPYSLIFDSSIGHHMLDFLAEIMKNYFNIEVEKLQQRCQKFFKQKFPDFAKYFPPTVYYYADMPISHNEFPLLDTRKKPKWRPSY